MGRSLVICPRPTVKKSRFRCFFNEPDEELIKHVKAVFETNRFRCFAFFTGNRLSIPSLLDKLVAEVSLEMLAVVIQFFQRMPDPMRDCRREDGVHEADPEHITRNPIPEEMDRSREIPENHGKTSDGEDGFQKAQSEING